VVAAAPIADATPAACVDHSSGPASRKEGKAPRIIPLENRAPVSETAEHQPPTDARKTQVTGSDVREKYEPLKAADSGTLQPVEQSRIGSSRIGTVKRERDPADRDHNAGPVVRVGNVTGQTALKCRFYTIGRCRNGQNCKFQHSANAKTERRKRQRMMAKLATDKPTSGTVAAPTASDP